MPAQPDLSALLGSRLCHDLIGPIGAIGNGVELLLLSGTGRSDEVALISESVAALNARIRFFRVAYGIARPDQTLPRGEVLDILSNLFPSGRITVLWDSAADLPRGEVKAAFLLLLCAEQALRSGGRIVVAQNKAGWSIDLASPRLRHDPRLWAQIDATAHPADAAIDPSEVQFPLAGQALARIARRPRITVTPETICISF
ncbi:histidine phosphotransferase family protein [Paragemmobacter ruber]|uniref:Histidine phosphotransferase n=1 Tax=Paragemmobacter ruber TaxID=1985673 RepID=A0ABW9YAC3_9RHOB|nr:histidine phosphotransferase family protein [Rhodobacter ruber]NBE09490.1 histidine phosphotransferase [Rhodobacter ruber]